MHDGSVQTLSAYSWSLFLTPHPMHVGPSSSYRGSFDCRQLEEPSMLIAEGEKGGQGLGYF